MHNYIFRIYALKVEKLEATDGDSMYKEVEANKIGEPAVIVGKYAEGMP